MEFNKLQKRFWANMIKSSESYRKGELCYNDFVYSLEGYLDAGEYRDKGLIEQWYNLWTPLEILSATKGNSATVEDAEKYLVEMESFLKSKSDFTFQEEE
jgi:hypothetical protein